jgi:hypothetical protein
LKKFAAMAITGAMLAAVPAFAAQTNRAAPVRDGFLTIGGPKRLVPDTTLRIPIRCSVDCHTKAVTKLTTPSDVVGPDKASGHLGAGHSKNLVVTLNEAAWQEIQLHPNSRLKVAVSAVSSDTGDQARAVKIFRFTSP